MSMYADYVFTNGSVITVDAEDRVCQAAAVCGNRIANVGRNHDMKLFVGPRTEVIDLKGRTLLPGFNDAHCHTDNYGYYKQLIECRPSKVSSIEDIKAKVAEAAKATPKGEWILGWGYDQTELAEKRHPDRRDLDAAAPDHNVILTRTCGHILAVNSNVLSLAGYKNGAQDPEGGRIDKDSNGEPTGLLFETARDPLLKYTAISEEKLLKGLELFNEGYLAYGITSAQDATGRNITTVKVWQDAMDDGRLKIRTYFMPRLSGGAQVGRTYLESGMRTGFGNDMLKLGSLKLMIDGSIGGSSAAVSQAYPADPKNLGISYMSQEELNEQVLAGHLAGWQVATHAIGDRGIGMVLTAYEKALKAYPKVNHRHRIEHFSLPTKAMVDKAEELGLVTVMGVPFIYPQGNSYLEILGEERTKGMLPLRSLVKRNVVAPLSSDGPIIEPNPMNNIYAAVTRKTYTGKQVAPEEAVDIKTAIRAHTLWGAYASFEEDIKGSIETGKLADLTVLSGDILKAREEEILELKADLTMVDGHIRYRRS